MPGCRRTRTSSTASPRCCCCRDDPRRTLRSSTTRLVGSAGFVQFINRAKDELVTPDDFDAFVDERAAHVRGSLRELRGRRGPPRSARATSNRCAKRPRRLRRVRANERAEERGGDADYKPDAADKIADREARRTIAATGYAQAAATSMPTTSRASTAWRPPTWPTAPRSRSSA